MNFLCGLQREDGFVVGEVVWSPVLTARYIFVAALTGKAIAAPRQARFLRCFRRTQTSEGGWGLRPEGPATVFVTVPVYVALRLLGRSADDSLCEPARARVQARGGVGAIPS
jgi:hypothetical protein